LHRKLVSTERWVRHIENVREGQQRQKEEAGALSSLVLLQAWTKGGATDARIMAHNNACERSGNKRITERNDPWVGWDRESGLFRAIRQVRQAGVHEHRQRGSKKALSNRYEMGGQT